MSQQSIICKAAIIYKEGTPLVIEDVTIDAPKNGEVRVKMVSAGICASDAHFVWGTAKLNEWPGHDVPAVLGHEGAGIVESVGPDVTNLQPGDHVLTTFMPACRDCPYCASPLTNFCAKENLIALGAIPNKKLTKNGQNLIGLAGLGIYSQYSLLKLSQVVKINPAAPLVNSAIISCAVATGFYAARNQANVQPGTTAAVWGIGAIGINAIYGCKKAGAKNIIGVDINNEKKAIGEEFGITEFVNPNELGGKPVDQYLKEKYGGVDYALDCLGNKFVIETAYKSLSVFGTLALVGLAPSGTELVLPVSDTLTGKKVAGAFMGNKDCDSAYTELTEMYVKGEYDVDRLVTHNFKLEQINEAFQLLKEGKCIRSLIIFDA